jgi:hypothetical protein
LSFADRHFVVFLGYGTITELSGGLLYRTVQYFLASGHQPQ